MATNKHTINNIRRCANALDNLLIENVVLSGVAFDFAKVEDGKIVCVIGEITPQQETVAYFYNLTLYDSYLIEDLLVDMYENQFGDV